MNQISALTNGNELLSLSDHDSAGTVTPVHREAAWLAACRILPAGLNFERL
jgi:hypothetical protein